ncbi:L-histidine N(alpha)-methyltransferase [Roseimicrobium sp. ORNL1]|uniref:L-histidine N(alpha)-methyltransferase n=1 Tax=Roseimicrobium sp. ORNL1 TaxID=2711231 RepID=UPI0013E12103|nr:L-histidine N(alpha)-methyltransferase [Roseimicrobium sp. ORNL1]QIF00531.1 L-histidine N(alpha)-methyltransferase [Roseimicrobium sp. ORNL1]
MPSSSDKIKTPASTKGTGDLAPPSGRPTPEDIKVPGNQLIWQIIKELPREHVLLFGVLLIFFLLSIAMLAAGAIKDRTEFFYISYGSLVLCALSIFFIVHQSRVTIGTPLSPTGGANSNPQPNPVSQVTQIALSSLGESAHQGSFESETRITLGIDAAGFGWTLCFIGEDQSDMLQALCSDLKRERSTTGDGKRFASGFSYWGIVPTLAWATASSDPRYVMMKQSHDQFAKRWGKLHKERSHNYHYVSLGVGTGKKDQIILSDLRKDFSNHAETNKRMFYFPVDMSPEMLRLGVKSIAALDLVKLSRLLPLQIDFANEQNIAELREMLDKFVGNEPILFSLLGNTLANFEDDGELLQRLSRLLRGGDKLLLEVASTETINDATVKLAAQEYAGSKRFCKFVTSSLLQYTDLPVNEEWVQYHADAEESKAIRLTMFYENKSPDIRSFRLPDSLSVNFTAGDTVRLYISRKYTAAGIQGLIGAAGMEIQHRDRKPFSPTSGGFGIDLLLLNKMKG